MYFAYFEVFEFLAGISKPAPVNHSKIKFRFEIFKCSFKSYLINYEFQVSAIPTLLTFMSYFEE